MIRSRHGWGEIISLGFLLAFCLGIALGVWAGYRAGHRAGVQEAHAACEIERANCERMLGETGAALGNTMDAWSNCLDANGSAVLALEALRDREDGCARFLTLDAWTTYRLKHAGERKRPP